MKKLIAFCLSLALCFSLAIPAFAAGYETYSFTGEYGTIEFDAVTVTKETVKFGGMEDDPYDKEVTLVTLKPGSHATVTGSFGANAYTLGDDGVYWMSSAYYDCATGPVENIFVGHSGVMLVLSFDEKIYVKLGDGTEVSDTAEPAVSAPAFSDVATDAYYADAVKWAVERGITNGTTATTFSPNNTCTTAQILTFLWRANGSPEPTIPNCFENVDESAYYYKAAVWACEKGMIGDRYFGGSEPCTRSSTVMYLWVLAGCPAATKTVDFSDVGANADYAHAVAWAVEQGITNGTSATTFTPNATCTRGQIVTFLHRDLAE